MQIGKRWLICTGNNFIGIDQASGGYFFVTDFWNAQKFTSFEAAEQYANTNWGSLKITKWEIYSCDEVGLQFVRNEKTDPYYTELATLKRKYGKD